MREFKGIHYLLAGVCILVLPFVLLMLYGAFVAFVKFPVEACLLTTWAFLVIFFIAKGIKKILKEEFKRENMS